MATILYLFLGFLAFLAILPFLRAVLTGAERTISAIGELVGLISKAGPALAVALPMVFHPHDLPKRWQPWSPLSLDQPINMVARWKVRAMEVNTGICREALATSRARAEFMADAIDSQHCHIKGRVRLTGLSRARMAPVQTQCEIGARLYLWERNVVQPAARRHLGQTVARIDHFSSYSCRKMRTSGGTSFRWSQHATANAFDISGFVLADGRRISLLRDWTRGGPEAAFLREVRDGACDWFNVVLSPDYNALHADHFHVDMGPFLSCR